MKIVIRVSSARELKAKIAAFKTLFDLRFIEPKVIEVATDYEVVSIGKKFVSLRGEGQVVKDVPNGTFTIEAPVEERSLFA